MKLDELQAAPGARTTRKRVGRGIGSGLGKTSGKGHPDSDALFYSQDHDTISGTVMSMGLKSAA